MPTPIRPLAALLLLTMLAACATPAGPIAAAPTPAAATPSPGPGKSAMPVSGG